MASSAALSNEIIDLQSSIINRLYELQYEKNKTQKQADILNIEKKLIPELIQKRVERDLPDLAVSKKMDLVSDVGEFISLGKQKGYITDENNLIVLRQLVTGLANIRSLPARDVYGQWSGVRGQGTFSLDFSKNHEFMKHIVFHELAHCITPDFGALSHYKVVQTGEKTKFGLNKWVRISDYAFGCNESEITFLRECIAESMACELDGTFEPKEPEKTEVGNTGLKSNWVTPWNRKYQELGDEFLQTLSFINTPSNNTDRKRFKALTMMAIMPNNTINKQIDEEYKRKNSKNGSKDLEDIAAGLSGLLKIMPPTKEETDAIRKKMQGYKEFPKKITLKTEKDAEVKAEEKTDYETIIQEILRLYSTLSPKSKAEVYAKHFGIAKQGEEILEQFFELSPESREEYLKEKQ